MAATPLSVSDQLKQLGDARKLVLGDANYYPQIIQGILPIIGPEARLELRRWGADFLAETFATPALPAASKETLSLIVLETLKNMIENQNEDAAVVKSVVQTAASIYPLVVRWIINNSYDKPTWERMTAIKSTILRMWDSVVPGVRICCIKFAQRVVLVQTPGSEVDLKKMQRSDVLGTSLAMIPQNHPLIPPQMLEAEGSGLLDRMLGVFQENSSDAVLIDATLNSLSILIRARPAIANKIVNAILSFNPLKLANSPMTPKTRVMIKSMEKTTRMLLIHVHKRDPQNPLGSRIQQYIERNLRSRAEILDDSSRKRGPPEPTDGLDQAKRQRLGAEVAQPPAPQIVVPPLAPGKHSIAELFTITTDEGLKTFNVSQLSADLVVKITVTIMSRLDPNTLNQAINGIRQRYLSLPTGPQVQTQPDPNTAPLSVDEDDDDYEPDFEAAEDTEQILNKLDTAPPPDEVEKKPSDVALGTFNIPPPPALTPEQAAEIGQGTISRVFGVMQTLEESTVKKSKAGINRLAASTYDRDAWITVITRLATRATAGLENSDPAQADEKPSGSTKVSLSDSIRESLYLYVLEDFRRRIDVAVAWLCEEWYNDKMLLKLNDRAVLHYEKWALRVLEGIVPYLDARDKILTRFLSEIPELSAEVLQRVGNLCQDPSLVNLSLTSLLYLVMMRPPVRELALDAMEEVWKTYDDARPMAGKHLPRWRPGFLEQQKKEADEAAVEAKVEAAEAPQNGVPVVN